MSGIVLLILRTALAITLYSFLGWALWILWRDLKQQQKVISLRQVPPLTLDIKLGDDVRHQFFDIPEIIIGRDPNCECAINSKTVSTHHARLSYHHSQWWVEDLESTNGTLLNQEQVSAPIVVTPGDQLRCGEALLTI